MKIAPYLKLTVLGIALLGVGQAMSDDLPLPTDPAQQREKMRGMTAEERNAQREQMQARFRSMTPEEQQLMRQTSFDGRVNMKQGQGDAIQQRSRDGSGKGGGYGQGYESRRGSGAGSAQGGQHGMGGSRGG